MSMSHTIIVIPIYKSSPSKEELASFKQCINVLKRHPICIITHKELNLNEYLKYTKTEIQVKYFSHHFFRSINGYSDLLRTQSFYLSFKKYQYILIYQLDAWVFKDELQKWCNKGYDYIGAPWFEHYGCHEEGAKLWKVGNGGLSLRKTKRFIQLTNPKRRLKNTIEVFKSEYNNIKSIPTCILRALGHRNTIGYFHDYYYHINEDVYFCIILSKFRNNRLYTPSPKEASEFSFERSPRNLYERNGGKLPFGCHAWEKYDKIFWNKHIKI